MNKILNPLRSFVEGAIPEVFARRCRCVGTLSQNILAKGKILLKENTIKKSHNITKKARDKTALSRFVKNFIAKVSFWN